MRPKQLISQINKGLVWLVVVLLLQLTYGSAPSLAHRHKHHHVSCSRHLARSKRRTAHNERRSRRRPACRRRHHRHRRSPAATGGGGATALGAAVTVPAGGPYFSPTSIWNAPLTATVSLDGNSASVVANLQSQIKSNNLGIATTQYGVPIYIVAATQPTVHVTLSASNPELQRALDAVPIPPGAQPAAGTDENLVVYQPATDTMWEFWHMTHQANGWHADWGGRLEDESSNPGYFQNMFDPAGNVLEQPAWGSTASSLALVGGVMTISELETGVIRHALALGITYTCAKVWAAPAQRTDGSSTAPNCVPEGAHFRLDPSLNLDSLNLPHFTLMMARAAQTYGIIINNRSAGFTFRGEDPTQWDQAHGYNPYLGPQAQPGTPGALFDEWPNQLLHAFPWSHLQLLKMDLRGQPDTTPVTDQQ